MHDQSHIFEYCSGSKKRNLFIYFKNNVLFNYFGIKNFFFGRICSQRFSSNESKKYEGGLNDFFDKEENWGESVVMVGRPWKVEELRLKKNEDLHKLWWHSTFIEYFYGAFSYCF